MKAVLNTWHAWPPAFLHLVSGTGIQADTCVCYCWAQGHRRKTSLWLLSATDTIPACALQLWKALWPPGLAPDFKLCSSQTTAWLSLMTDLPQSLLMNRNKRKSKYWLWDWLNSKGREVVACQLAHKEIWKGRLLGINYWVRDNL